MALDEPLPFGLVIDRRLPRASQIYDAMRAAVLDMRLKPGDPISENRICRHTNVSRTPAREALIRLEQDGLIEVFPQHGSFIAPISIRSVIEGHFIRQALETALIRRAQPHWSRGGAAKAEQILAAQRAAAEADDPKRFFFEDENFHRLFATIAEMDGVSEVIKVSNTHLARVRQLATPLAGHMEAAIADHQSIVDAMGAGQTDDAAEAMRRHLARVFQTVSRLVQHYRQYFGDFTERDLELLADG
jgi:DNA-binding GntR family transcriptional regulator